LTTRLKLDQEAIGLASLLERIAGVRVKDSFRDEEGETVYFIVEEGQLGKAIGKDGVHVKRLQQELGKKVRLVEFHPDVVSFIKSAIAPLTAEEIVEEAGSVMIKDSSKKTKSLLIGRGGKNLKLLNRAVKRFFQVEEVKVV